jgi:nitronate monooxygenase
MLGASGVMMGTRFIATVESAAPALHKKAIVSGDSDQTTLSDAFTGHYARFLRNEYTKQYRQSGAPVLPPVLQQMAARDIVEAAVKQEVPSFYTLYAGQGVGSIDTVPAAGDVVRSVIAEARDVIRAAPGRLGIASA